MQGMLYPGSLKALFHGSTCALHMPTGSFSLPLSPLCLLQRGSGPRLCKVPWDILLFWHYINTSTKLPLWALHFRFQPSCFIELGPPHLQKAQQDKTNMLDKTYCFSHAQLPLSHTDHVLQWGKEIPSNRTQNKIIQLLNNAGCVVVLAGLMMWSRGAIRLGMRIACRRTPTAIGFGGYSLWTPDSRECGYSVRIQCVRLHDRAIRTRGSPGSDKLESVCMASKTTAHF